MQCENLVTIADLFLGDIDELFALTTEIKESYKRNKLARFLDGKTPGMILRKARCG